MDTGCNCRLARKLFPETELDPEGNSCHTYGCSSNSHCLQFAIYLLLVLCEFIGIKMPYLFVVHIFVLILLSILFILLQ